MRNNKKTGFTLVELLVVIAIIAILATVSVVGYTAFLTKANQSNANTEANQVQQAINAYLLDGSDYVIGTVDAKVDIDEDADGIQYADGAEKTTYIVKASDKNIYKIVETYVAADSTWTAADAVLVDSNTDITDAFNESPDFGSLKGNFKVDAEGNITYTYEGVTATIKLN